MGELVPISLPSAQNQSRSGLVASTTLVNCYRETNTSLRHENNGL